MALNDKPYKQYYYYFLFCPVASVENILGTQHLFIWKVEILVEITHVIYVFDRLHQIFLNFLV